MLAPFLITIIPSTPEQAETESGLTEQAVEVPPSRRLPSGSEDGGPADHVVATAKPASAPAGDTAAADAPPARARQPDWRSITVQSGDNMSLIFDRLGLGAAELYKVMHADQQAAALKNLIPGQELRFRIDDGALQSLEYEKDLTTTLVISRDDSGFTGRLVTTPLEKRVVETEGTINHSLYLAGKNAGMSDNLIMQLVAIYGWDIDFALNIRSGDHFKVLYEEHYKDGELVREGPILAADFSNRGKSFQAVRYTDPGGHTDFYSENGASMRKAFLRNPLDVFRISSHFSLGRKHPILNRIRAHEGTDYAAPTGTPVKATGDGRVLFIGRKGGYGNAIVLKHGGRYSTLYGHMSRFRKGLHQGSHVQQGQVIGYVGMTGLATGPHLHYEFRVNGVHRNPVTVKLPKADSIPDKYMDDFRLKSRTLLAELQEGGEQQGKTVLAMREEEPDEQPLPDKL